MGKCSECGNRIRYNRFKIIKGKVYCPDCKPPKRVYKRKQKVENFNPFTENSPSNDDSE